MISEARYRNMKFFWTNRLELIKRTGKIFTARSHHHGKVFNQRVEHKLTGFSARIDPFWHPNRTCSRDVEHAFHRWVACSRHAGRFYHPFGTCRNLDFFWTNRLELTQGTGKISTAGSYYHGNTFKYCVKHRLTEKTEISGQFLHASA